VNTQKTKAYKGMAMEGVIATWYAGNTQNDVADRRNVIKTITDNLPRGGRVLEVAPGPGYLSIELAKSGNYQLTGLDISKSFVEIAQAKAKEAGVTVDFRHGNASDMPLESSVFDFIVCRAAFKNFADPVGAVSEMHRVLKPGGKALIIDLRPDVSRDVVNDYVKSIHMNLFNALMTRWTFQMMLKKTAYPKETLKEFAAQSSFGACNIVESAMGYEVWLQR
jgi:ubiquinone/menaquinone biosynthesis C-methylase UbiE